MHGRREGSAEDPRCAGGAEASCRHLQLGRHHRPPGRRRGDRAHAVERRFTSHQGEAAVGGLSLSQGRSEEHTSELQSLMRISYAVFCLKKKTKHLKTKYHHTCRNT